MAESLGEALLSLRTDDREFTGGVGRAQKQAEGLGQAFDRTRDKSQELGEGLAAAGGAAAVAGNQFNSAAQGVTRSAQAQRAGMQQLSMQLNDVATMYALGARPMQIFASQGGQVIQAVQLMSGGTSRLASFLAGPWGLALTTAAIVLVPLIGNLLNTEQAMQKVEFATDKMGDAQGILGTILDRTTGKIKTQSAALINLARAQAIAGQVEAKKRLADAQGTVREVAKGEVNYLASGASLFAKGQLSRPRDPVADITRRFKNGMLSPEQTINLLEGQLGSDAGANQRVLEAMSAVSAIGVERGNITTFEQLENAINGDPAAMKALGFGPEANTRNAPSARSTQGPPQKEDRTEQNEARYQDELGQLRTRLLAEEARYTENITQKRDAELAAIDEELLSYERQLGLREDLTDTQRAELLSAKQALGEQQKMAAEQEYGRDLVEQQTALRESELQSLADDAALRSEMAENSRDRKLAELDLFDLTEQLRLLKLEEILANEATTDAAWQRARAEKQWLEKSRDARRGQVEERNASPLEAFIRDIDRVGASMDDQMELVATRGLDSLNDKLVDAIMNAESLGDVFEAVANQIIADLLRIAIQQAIIGPLANALFGGGGGAGSLFAGFFATGGLIPSGQFGIVGENGPEPVIGTSQGAMVLPNSSLRGGFGGGTSVTVPISIDATGADPAGLERVRAQLDQLQESLPGIIVSTVQDAGDRRVLSPGSWR